MATEYDGIIAELARIGDLIEAMRNDALTAQTTALASLAAQTTALENLELPTPEVPDLPDLDVIDPRPFVVLPLQTQVQALGADGRVFLFPDASLLRWTAQGFIFCGADGAISEIVFTTAEQTLPNGLALTLDPDYAYLIQPAPDPDEDPSKEDPALPSCCDQCGLVHEGAEG